MLVMQEPTYFQISAATIIDATFMTINEKPNATPVRQEKTSPSLLAKLPTQRGLTMLEILVAIFVFAIGVLGVAAIQLKSVHLLSDSNFVSSAVDIAGEVAERMRSNPEGIKSNAYNGLSIDLSSNSSGTGSGGTTTPCSNGCSSANMVTNDTLALQQSLATQLPSGALTVNRISDVSHTYNVKVSWSAPIREDRKNTNTPHEIQSHNLTLFFPNIPTNF